MRKTAAKTKPTLTRRQALTFRKVGKGDLVHWAILTLLAVACIATGYIGRFALSPNEERSVNAKLSKIDLPDRLPNTVLTTPSGDSAKLHDLLRTPLSIVTFYASWCEPCQKELAELSEHFADRVSIVIVVDGKEDPAKVQEKIKRLNLKIANYYFDNTRELFAAGRIEAYPTTYLVKNRGEIVDGVTGFDKVYMKRFDLFLERLK